MKTLILIQGGSDEHRSRRALEIVTINKAAFRIARPDLRQMLSFGMQTPTRERVIKESQAAIAALLLDQGYIPVVDDEVVDPIRLKYWEHFVQFHDAKLRLEKIEPAVALTLDNSDDNEQTIQSEIASGQLAALPIETGFGPVLN